MKADRDGADRILRDGPWTTERHEELQAQLEGEPLPHHGVERFGALAQLALERGTALLDAGELKAAEAILRRALVLDPLHLEACFELARVLARREDDEALRAFCDRAIELLRFNLGNLAIREEAWEMAREAFAALVEKVPTHRDARVNLVSVLCRLERRPEAREHLRELEERGLERDLLEALRERCFAAV